MSPIDPILLAKAVREVLGREPVDEAERRRAEADVLIKVAIATPLVDFRGFGGWRLGDGLAVSLAKAAGEDHDEESDRTDRRSHTRKKIARLLDRAAARRAAHQGDDGGDDDEDSEPVHKRLAKRGGDSHAMLVEFSSGLLDALQHGGE